MVLMVVASQSPEFLINFGVPVLGLSAGHMYAGDPVRGGLVMVASTLTGVGVFSLLNPSGGNGGGGAYVVALAASSVAIGIAAADAYFTTVERNQTRRGSSDAIDQEAP
jgi:Zn-dependent protease with chaperone function